MPYSFSSNSFPLAKAGYLVFSLFLFLWCCKPGRQPEETRDLLLKKYFAVTDSLYAYDTGSTDEQIDL